MKKFLYAFIVCIACYQCSPKSTGPTVGFRANALSDSTQIFLLQPDESLPAKSEFVRELDMGYSLFSNECGYKNLINYARFTAKQSGANLVHLADVKKPTLGNGCYRIKAKLYRNFDDDNLVDLKKERIDANKSRLPQDADYAIIHFYRPKSFEGAAISYKIKMDDKGVIGKASNGAHFEYKVTSFGKHKFFGKTKKSDSVTLDIEKGQEYFVRCGVAKGSSISLPDMFVAENYVGRQELAEMQ